MADSPSKMSPLTVAKVVFWSFLGIRRSKDHAADSVHLKPAQVRPHEVSRHDRILHPPLARLTLAQDTGGAIRGAVRADYFWGFGPNAGREAGRMRQDGRMWLLWPKDAALPGS